MIAPEPHLIRAAASEMSVNFETHTGSDQGLPFFALRKAVEESVDKGPER